LVLREVDCHTAENDNIMIILKTMMKWSDIGEKMKKW
jgi:hypothetical protein